MKIVVLAGGNSTERDVSLSSGGMIYHALKNNGHQAVLLDVYLGIEGDTEGIFTWEQDWAASVSAVGENAPDVETVKALRKDGEKSFFGPNVLKICQEADCVFLALHGANGEDGRIQACFELMGISYTGADSVGSCLAMDKGIAKDLFQTYHIPTPAGIRLKKGEARQNTMRQNRALQSGNLQRGKPQSGNLQSGKPQSDNLQSGNLQSDNLQSGKPQSENLQSGMAQSENLQSGMAQGELPQSKNPENEIPYPRIVKASCGGSSIGVCIARNEEEYEKAMEEAFRYGDEIIVEQYIRGREFSVGVLDGKALPVIEMAPKAGFYDYKNKYQPGTTVETCPARIPEEKARKMQEISERVFRALRLKSYARMDFVMNEAGEVFCLEGNTLPGMTPTSLLPQEAAAAGMDFGQLCEAILGLAHKKSSESRFTDNTGKGYGNLI